MANELPVKIRGRIRSAEKKTHNKDGVEYTRPFGQLQVELVEIKVVNIMCQVDDLPEIIPMIGTERELPVLQSIESTGRYAGQANYKLQPKPAKA